MFLFNFLIFFFRAPDNYQISAEFKSACNMFENDDLSKGDFILHIM